MALKQQGLFLAWAKRGLIIEFMVTLNIDLSHTFAIPNIGYKIAHLCDATHLAPPRTGSALTYREGRAGEQISDVTCLMLHCYTIMSESAHTWCLRGFVLQHRAMGGAGKEVHKHESFKPIGLQNSSKT